MASTLTSSHTFNPTLLPLSNSDAKPDTVEKVIDIVRSQLALKEDTAVSGETKFTDLGADSLDTVEIVMQLEENFDITVDEDSAQTIATIHDAASLIEELSEKKKAAAANSNKFTI